MALRGNDWKGLETVLSDTERDNWLSVETPKESGLIDALQKIIGGRLHE